MIEITDEAEAAARRRSWRCRKALREAPDLIAHVRGLVTRDSRGERGDAGGAVISDGDGVPLPGLREHVSPLRITPTDDADRVFSELVGWVRLWGVKLDAPVPLTARIETAGFRAGTSADRAFFLTRTITSWLEERQTDIEWHIDQYGDRAEWPDRWPGYVEDVTRTVWQLRSKYPMEEPPEQPAFLTRPAARECTVCHFNTVTVGWFNPEDPQAPSIRCRLCGYEPRTPAEVASIMRRVL